VAWILILIEQGLDDRHLMDLGLLLTSTESLEGLGLIFYPLELRHIYIPCKYVFRSFFPLG